MSGTEWVGRPMVAYNAEPDRTRAGLEVRDARPIARCHPERRLWAAGLCEDCFAARDRERTLETQRTLRGSPMPRAGHLLSPREEELLQLLSKGRTNKEAGHDLGITEQTVKNHMTSILRKMGASDRTQATIMFLDSRRTEVGVNAYLAHITEQLTELRDGIDRTLVALAAGEQPVLPMPPLAFAPKKQRRTTTERLTELIDTVLRHAGNRAAAARELGVAPTTVNYAMRRAQQLGIDVPQSKRGRPRKAAA